MTDHQDHDQPEEASAPVPTPDGGSTAYNQPAPYTGTTEPVQGPGWYPAAPGRFRWWDGGQWGEWRPAVPPTADNAKTLALLAHLGTFVGGFIAPLIVFLVEKQNPWVRHHAAEALNFQLTVLVALFVSIPLFLVIVGFFTMLATIVCSYVFSIIGAVKAGRGEWYRYPITIRMIKP